MCRTIVLFLVILLIGGCQTPEQKHSEDDVLLAEVFDRKLYASQLEKLIPPTSTSADSAAMANAYVEQWIRENLILHEAERNKPKDLSIEKLVDEYRSSLLKFHYEKKIVDEKLDSMISVGEMESFYDENKSQYLLKEPILKAQIAILDKESDGNKRLQTLWAQDEWPQIKSLCTQNNCTFYSGGSVWISLREFRILVPIEVMSFESIKGMKKIHESREEYEFYLKVIDFRDENETPPLEFIKDQLTKVILHKRKQKILKELAEHLYEAELKRNNVKVHSNS